jgi:hypothetical protein
MTGDRRRGAIDPSLPRWDCRNRAEQHEFERWTNQQLDAEELEGTTDPFEDKDFLAAHKRDIIKYLKSGSIVHAGLKRRLVIHAMRTGDWETAAQLMDTEQLRRAVLRPQPRGRRKGEPRPRDVSPRMADAAIDYGRIRALWRQHYNKYARVMAPKAIDIAARRRGVDSFQLFIYLKNRR